ncbi:MAG TPA: esterase [Burkholderiales bacterium]|nr:esterase [Burkholderiales bacterium]
MRAIHSLAVLILAGCAQAPIALRDMGSFHVGGRDVEISGKPVKEVVFTPGGVPAKVDPNGTYSVEAMYVQYFLPAERRGVVPLLMWHGGGLTGVTYETTPDGREGWLTYFVRQGWDVYNSDAVERGRAGWAMVPDIFKSEPVFLTKANPFERFRIGQGAGSYSPDPAKQRVLPGSQFPVAAYDNFVKQNVPRWTTTDDAILRAYLAEIDKVCPCAILFHSQAGQFGFRAAQARPDKVKALIAVEPAGIGDPQQAAALKGIPVLMLYGDFIAQDARWPQIRKNGIDFTEGIARAGGKVEVVDLPNAGIRGNSHLLMMDRNNLEIAALIQRWLEDQGLYQESNADRRKQTSRRVSDRPEWNSP